MRFMLAWKSMTLGPKKHEKVAIFRRKMSEFRMFQGAERPVDVRLAPTEAERRPSRA